MVGKPNLPDDFDQNPQVKGSAVKDPSLDPLDQERAASMADEGGASAVTIPKKPRHHYVLKLFENTFVFYFAIGAIVGLLLRRN